MLFNFMTPINAEIEIIRYVVPLISAIKSFTESYTAKLNYITSSS